MQDKANQVKIISKGDILSRTSYMIVESDSKYSNRVNVMNTEETKWDIDKGLLSSESLSADYYKEEKKVSRTEICHILENTNSAVFTVNYFKAVDNKEVLNTLKELYPNKGNILSRDKFNEEVESILNKIQKGEERTLRGYLTSNRQEFGRYQAVDLDLVFKKEKSSIRQIDSKTINWLIFNEVRYIVK